jgi:copper transport protein
VRASRPGGARLAAAAAVALLACLTGAARAEAHAEVVRAEPSGDCGPRAASSFAREQPCPGGGVLAVPPGAVRILFGEPVVPVAGGISVLAPSGRRVDRGPARAEGALLTVEVEAAEEGTYQVRWRVVAEDAHPARGAFAFSVGRVTAADPVEPAELGAVAPLGLALQIAGRWLHFLGYALAFGTLAAGHLAGRDRPPPVGRRMRLVSVGILLLVLAEPVALLGQTASLEPSAPLAPDLLADAAGSSFGRALGLRLAAALLLWTLVGAMRDRPSRRLGWVALALGLAVAVVDAGSAHVASFRPLGIGLLVGGLHVAGMGIWIGALAAALADGQPPASRSRPVALALATLTLTGLALALVHLGPGASGLATPYGWALAAKLAALAVALGLAAAAARRPASAARRRALEAVALAAVLALAGALVSLPPPR